MPRDRALSIGFILSVVLAAGCGRARPLTVPPGADVEPRDGSVAGPDASILTADASTKAPPSLPPNRYRVIALAVGRTHNCVILDDHKVKCWGDNASGQLGYGDQIDRGTVPATMGDNLPTVDLGTGRTAKRLTAGRYATCAILDDDEVKCWGVGFLVGPDSNATGEVGDQPGEMGDNLPPINLGAGRKPVAVAIGFTETCVALDDGSFLCWNGAPTTKVAAAADGARVVQLAQDVETIGVFDDGSVRRISLNFPDGPTRVDFGGLATFVAGASTVGHIDYVILQSGGTACIPPQNNPIVPIDASVVALGLTEYESPCGLDSAGVVTCWRIQYHPEWGGGTVRVPLDQPATSIGAGDYNACALLADGTVKCWAMDGTYPLSLGGSVSTSTGWPAVDLGTRPTP
jgi:Regulator of chromosome condensation (RCC1) repeat